ncbi:hypothetical protein ACEPAG_6719 [Sanghuangporus baumii]
MSILQGAAHSDSDLQMDTILSTLDSLLSTVLDVVGILIGGVLLIVGISLVDVAALLTAVALALVLGLFGLG